MDLKDFEVIDGRNLSGDELLNVLRNNGVGVKTIPKEKRQNKPKEKEKVRTLRPQKPLCDYTKEDTIVAKRCDIQEIYSDLDLIYDFNRDTMFAPNSSFTSRHGAAVHSLYIGHMELVDSDSYKEQMDARKAAFDYVMYNIIPDTVYAKIEETCVAELNEKLRLLAIRENYMGKVVPYSLYSMIKKTDGAELHEKQQVTADKEYSTELFTHIVGNHHFIDEVHKARTIKEAYEYVMTAGDEEDMEEAQEMMDKYTSIFSDDLEKVLAYEPHEKREIPMDKRCEASKQRVFKQNDTIQLVVPNSWTKRRQSYKGEFDVVTFPSGFFIGEGASKVDLSGYSFTYTISPIATDDTNGGVYTLNDGLLKSYDFCYGSLLTLSRSVRNSLGTGWEKEYINAVSIKSLMEGIKEYAASKSDEFKVVKDESENTNTESCTITKEMCR